MQTGKKSWLRGSRLEFFLRQQWFSNKIKFPHDSQSETKFGTFMEPRELKENIRNMKSIGKVERLHWRSTKDHSYGAQVVVVIVIGCWRCVYRGSQLGEGDPWRRPPRLGPSSVRRAMVGCPTHQAHNTHSPPCRHKAGDDRVLHRLVRRSAARWPTDREAAKPTGHHEWQPSALLRTSCDIRSSVILGSRDSFVQSSSSSSFQTFESSSTCRCALKQDCRMPADESLRMGSAWSMVEWLVG